MESRLTYGNREEWLKGRTAIHGIGASEAAASAGASKRTSRTSLWRIKTGQEKAPDLSGNEAVQRGIRMEGAVREMFKGLHPELIVVHRPYDILFQTETPWLFATLDAETLDPATGEQGVVEIKNVQPRTREDWAEWEGRIPDDYYRQLLHQHLATKRNRLWLAAALYRENGDVIYREYAFEADAGFRADAKIQFESEKLFMEYVERRQMPPLQITL